MTLAEQYLQNAESAQRDSEKYQQEANDAFAKGDAAQGVYMQERARQAQESAEDLRRAGYAIRNRGTTENSISSSITSSIAESVPSYTPSSGGSGGGFGCAIGGEGVSPWSLLPFVLIVVFVVSRRLACA